ncbi:hypothetical protein [Acidianus sp. HS-5]|uniref:hypothetical protein n=1 Tax=Acidianus sp. HS-5 TaxID=2886040 RepID=UPI001F2DD2B2|nr:hypothetical protein [Acidianus sp. HS-5]BDC18741.1 hypothetical protein HS5_16310 [Acidianus sp. HS-5]
MSGKNLDKLNELLNSRKDLIDNFINIQKDFKYSHSYYMIEENNLSINSSLLIYPLYNCTKNLGGDES